METTIHLRGLPADESMPLGELLGELVIWLQAEAETTLESIEVDEGAERHPGFSARLHPAAPPVAFRDDGAGAIEFRAETGGVGPGYQGYLLDLFERLAADIGIRIPQRAEVADEATHASTRDALEEAHLEWLRRNASERLAPDADWRRPLTSMAERVRALDDRLPTALGGRDREWVAAVARDPREGIDALPWWSEGTGAGWQRGRALTEMWSEVRWRPLIAELEEEVIESILDDLEAAHALDAELDYPYVEWRELYALLDGLREMPGYVAAAPENREPLVGYRRGPVRVRVEDWTMIVPGELLEEWRDEYWWLGDRGRDVFLQSFDADEDAPAELDPRQAVAGLPDEEGEVFEAHDADVARRAVWQEGAEEGSLLHAAVASGRRLLLLTMRFDDAASRQWAFELWRSVEPA